MFDERLRVCCPAQNREAVAPTAGPEPELPPLSYPAFLEEEREEGVEARQVEIDSLSSDVDPFL